MAMTRIVRTDHGTFELVTAGRPRDRFRLLRFLDADEALRQLRRMAAEPLALAALRLWAQEVDLGHSQDGPLLSRLAAALADGRLRLALDDRLPYGTGTGTPAGPRPPRPGPTPPAPGPGPTPEIVTELVVHVKDADGKPVKDANVLAGALGERRTNDQGVADYGRVRPGTYDVSAEKPGHSPERLGKVGMHEKKKVDVPAGSRTEVHLVQHPQCANVAWFEGPDCRPSYSGLNRLKYYAFDHTTNIAEEESKQYWTPVPEKGGVTLPADRMTRDATRWVSLAVGGEVELEINFDFKDKECIPCIANTTFEIEGDPVAEVTTTSVTAKKAAFKFKGKAEGEATLFVKCDGNKIGRFHIWCKQLATINIDLVRVVTSRASEPSFDVATLTGLLDEIFRQAVLQVSLRDLGSVDLSGSAAFATEENAGYPNPGGGTAPVQYNGDRSVATAIHSRASNVLDNRAPADGPSPRDGAYRLYYYVPDAGAGFVRDGNAYLLNGFALGIGSRVCLILHTRPDHYNTAAHEFGHCLRLRHPAHDRPEHRDDSAGAETGKAAQFLDHNHSTCGVAIDEEIKATNTEPRVGTMAGAGNVMANDPLNLMGYFSNPRTNRKQLRYLQWKAARRD